MVNILKLSQLSSNSKLSEKELSSVVGGEEGIPNVFVEAGKLILGGGARIVGGAAGRAVDYINSPRNLTSNDTPGFTNVNANNYGFDSSVRIK
jgi:bacteriocin-like protein